MTSEKYIRLVYNNQEKKESGNNTANTFQCIRASHFIDTVKLSIQQKFCFTWEQQLN